MAHKLRLSATILVACSGLVMNEDGQRLPFSFSLVCDRIKSEAIKPALESVDHNMAAFMRKVARDWRDMLDEDDKPLAFSAASFDELLSQTGVPKIIYDAYCEACAAKAKN